MSLQSKLLMTIGIILATIFGVVEYQSFHSAKENAARELRSQADKVHSLLMAYREVQQKVFLEDKVELTPTTLKLLPAYAIGQISANYHNWDASGFSFNNVSDQPRNPGQMADEVELKAMGYFRENPGQKVYFQPFEAEGQDYYLYARPIWIKKSCIKCHGKREDAPPTIRDRYDSAWNYQIGDLRGVLSIKLPASTLMGRAMGVFRKDLLINLFGFSAVFLIVTFLIRRNVSLPVEELVSGMQAVAGGDYNRKLAGFSSEFALISDEFNQMIERVDEHRLELNTLNEQLEQRVERRTAQLEDINMELRTTLETLKQTQDQLVESEKLASLGSLVAGVAHEINTPVGNGLTAISIIEDRVKKMRQHLENDALTKSDFEKVLGAVEQAADIVHINLGRAAHLVNSFKRVAVDQSSEAARKFVLGEYIDEVLLSLHPVLRKVHHHIHTECPDNLLINSVPGAIAQILTNLIMNSITHAFEPGEEGQIWILITTEDENIRLNYRDNGKGIPKDVHGKVFEPFFTTARDKGGSGLGLNIAYNLVTVTLKGKIKLNSATEGGFNLDITFPATLAV
ncbi:MAG: DUF3365 domain-containing protein [Gammaproteobacteria bacterium]|nr:DUF3365 domain-containing protein [Gammaproteobacteria bacterium]